VSGSNAKHERHINRILSKNSSWKTNLRILTAIVLYDILQKDTKSGITEDILNKTVKA
jgi:hypothetical protein